MKLRRALPRRHHRWYPHVGKAYHFGALPFVDASESLLVAALLGAALAWIVPERGRRGIKHLAPRAYRLPAMRVEPEMGGTSRWVDDRGGRAAGPPKRSPNA